VGTSPLDPVALGVAVAVQIAAVVLANWWPARRASRVDPLRALSAE
jgi:ABC-type antimicrobial peptide transport system permease subunit